MSLTGRRAAPPEVLAPPPSPEPGRGGSDGFGLRKNKCPSFKAIVFLWPKGGLLPVLPTFSLCHVTFRVFGKISAGCVLL